MKPWEEDTNLAELEKKIREIVMEGLVWGKSELKRTKHNQNGLDESYVFEYSPSISETFTMLVPCRPTCSPWQIVCPCFGTSDWCWWI